LLDGEFPAQTLESVREVVASGIGIQEARGDSVVVESFVFDKTYIDEEQREQDRLAQREFRNLLVKSGVISLVCLIIFLFTLSMLRHAFLIRAAKQRIKESQENVMPQGVAVSEQPGEVALESVTESPLGDEVEQMRVQIKEIAQQDPERIAKAIKELITG
jgi:flagellar biosynthesis/type III secretory pathway M-ring protein FliF/YscJ